MSSTPSSSSNGVLSSITLHILARIKRFLKPKATRVSSDPSDQLEISITKSESNIDKVENCESARQAMEKQSCEEEQSVISLKSCVKKLHFGSWEEKEMTAKEIERLAKEDVRVRKLITELGVVPELVSMVASEVAGRQLAGLKALVQLAHGSYKNKALIVEAGIFSKLPKRVDLDESTRRECAELLLSLSSLANSQFPLASLDFLPFIKDILESDPNVETKQSCLGALCNLSTVLENVGPLVSAGVVPILLELSSIKENSEKALATLGNLVVTLMGKKAIENSLMMPESLIEILTWEDKPKCQELSAYILMILAHQSSSQTQKMAQAGIVPVLLEVALLGSQLAQKRALKLLQWFKDERQSKMGPHSGPQTPRMAMGSPADHIEAKEGKRMMKSLVKQSLHRNMEIITQRASTPGDPTRLKSLVISTSSKSLPY
ncbi:U-box domain-containing protein 7-like [Neltuma alba]|uniref:U-box domain-containing protein 7-like n=1 Tax=Neltuma alba TaxID=207710 RepID=UPI0010A35435|nr:U-box domain-containing protein 7-like [Prosopis alba]XP_028764894.1 U-box domain-containing protein 7-like [Prosopis alba]